MGLEAVCGNVGDADGGDLLALGHSGLPSQRSLGNRRSITVGAVSFAPVTTPPVDLLEQFTASPNSAPAYPGGEPVQRLVVRLLGVGRQRGSLVRPRLTLVDIVAGGQLTVLRG